MITVHQESERRRSVLEGAFNQAVERRSLTMAWLWRRKINEITRTMEEMTAHDAGQPYDPDQLYMAVVERTGTAVAVVALV